MKIRVISGLVMVPILFGILYFGGPVLAGACFLIAVIGVSEFFSGFENMGVKPSKIIAYIAAILLYLINVLELPFSTYMLWFFISVLLPMLYMFKINERKLGDGIATMTGIFYVVFFSYHILLVSQLERYSLLVWLVFFSAFGSDIMAYFTGYLIGKHKLCPNLSPKKTVEGAVGGLLGGAIACGIFGLLFLKPILPHCLIMGASAAAFSQIGDLTASLFKRKMGIKDYGELIPGHGGIMDRFDSILFTAPFIYYYAVFVIGAV